MRHARGPVQSLRLISLVGLAIVALGSSGCEQDDANGYDGDAEQPPEDVADMLDWARAGGYQAWDAESAPHPSAGPHEQVQAFMNPALIESLAAGNMHHPPGVMAVKENLDADGKLRGWSISLKVAATESVNPDPEAWYWWQWRDGELEVEGNGIEPCRGCHSAGFVEGKDFVLSPFPLQ